uniref:DNA helicase n=1 Tax=Macrostomum lignano TaxID=282301 RepID=A0A1I8G6U5_9PLAT
MSLLDIADFNPNLFGKHGDTEKKEDDDEEAAAAAAAIASSAGSASASAGGPPAAAVGSSSEDESDRNSEASRSATRARQQRQQLKQQQLKQQKAKPAPKAASSGGKRRGRLSDSDDEQKPQQLEETGDASSNSSSPAAASSTSESSKRLPHQRRHTAPVKQQRAGRTGSGSGGGESLRAAIEDDPELWGVRRSGRSRQKPTRLAVGHEDEEDSDEAGGGHPQHPHPQQQQLFAQRKRRRGSASASGGKRRRRSGVTFSLSDEDNGANSSDDNDGGSSSRLNSAAAAGSSSDDDDATSSSSSSLPAPAAARKRRRGGSAASAQSQKKQRQLRSSRRSSGRVRSYRELSSSGEDAKVDASSDDGDYVAESAAPRRSQQQQQQQHGQRSSGGGQLKPSNKLHPMLRTATDAPPRQAAGTRGAGKRPETRGASEAALRPLRKFSSHSLGAKTAQKSDSDDSDNDNEPDLAGEPSQEEMEARLSHSDFLAPPTEDAEGIERVLNYRVGRKGATGDKTTFYNVLEERDPNDGFDPSQEDGDVQFFIKWRGWSHLHNTWESMDSLAHKCVDGLKKIVNFKQRIEEIREWKKTATPEELESFNYHEEVNENLLAEHRQVERVVAHSKAPAGGYSDYYCKWAGLPYSDCSWEDGQLVTKLFLSAVEEYETRLKAQTLPNRNCKALKYRPKFRQLKSQPKYMSPENAENRLRDYQLDGVNWLYHSWTRGYSSILADEMGLGKTIQTICFLSVLFHEHEIYGPFLLVVPLSTVIGWKREFANWAPQMNVILYLGDVDSRNIIRSYEWQQELQDAEQAQRLPQPDHGTEKCCNHTFLVQEPPQLTDRCERLESLIRGSGKMLLLDKLLWNLRAGGHRVLIFSQMVMMLDVLAEYLSLRNWAFQRLDGTILGEARKQALDAFNAESSQDFCFLLSTRAGGLGVNLASADTVVIFDSDWNPQNDLQAMARCHRIGQTRQVRVYRLVLRATVEEDIIERAKQKMVLDHLVIQRMDTTGRLRQPGDAGNPAFSKDELSAILKFGAADLFREKEGEESEAEVDLDAILRSAETREELQPTSAAAEELLSQFKVVNLENLEDTEIIMSGGGPSGRRKGQATATAAGDSAGQSAEPAASKTWEEIIPEESRRRIEQEEAEERLLQLELGPRQRKQVKPLNVGAEDEEELSDREIRALAKAMRKFASPLDRLDSVVEEAELQEKSETEVRRLVEAILQGCERAVAKAATFATGEEASAKPSAPSFTLGRVVIQARPLLQSQKDLAPLHREMPADREARRKYRVPFYTKTVTWDCVWDEIDDSNLLIGVYEFGMDSWDAIKDDPDLGLRAKILRDHNLKPQAAHLRTRTDYLLKMLQRHEGGNLEARAPSAVAAVGARSRRAHLGAAGKDQSQQQQQQQQQQHQQQQPIS